MAETLELLSVPVFVVHVVVRYGCGCTSMGNHAAQGQGAGAQGQGQTGLRTLRVQRKPTRLYSSAGPRLDATWRRSSRGAGPYAHALYTN